MAEPRHRNPLYPDAPEPPAQGYPEAPDAAPGRGEVQRNGQLGDPPPSVLPPGYAPAQWPEGEG